MSWIRLEVGVGILLSFIEKAYTTCAISIVFIDIHQDNFISPFLKEILGNHDKVHGRLGDDVDAIDGGLLDDPALEVNEEILGWGEAIEVKVEFCKAIVLSRGHDQVKLVGDAALLDKVETVVSSLDV